MSERLSRKAAALAGAPAFQFYAADFLASVSSLTLEEVGAHAKLLAWSWDNGPVPNDPKRLAMILGVPTSRARRVWAEVSKRWRLGDDVWTNPRLERTRDEQAAYAASVSNRGKAGAQARWQRQCSSNGTSTAQAMPNGMPKNGPPISDLRSPDLRESTERSLSEGRARAIPPDAEIAVVMADGAPLIDGHAIRRHAQHKRCYTARGLCVTPWVWDELLGRLGGDASTQPARLGAWMDSEIAASGTAPIGDKPDDWWRKRFAAWVGVAAMPTNHAGKGNASRDAALRVVQRLHAAPGGTIA